MPDEKEPRAGTDAGHSREARRNRDEHTLRHSHRNINRDFAGDAGRFPGIDLNGQTLDEIRRKIRGRDGQEGGIRGVFGVDE